MNSFKYIYLFNLLENHLQSSLQKKDFCFWQKSSENVDSSARLSSGSNVETRRGKREALSDSQESSQDSQSKLRKYTYSY